MAESGEIERPNTLVAKAEFQARRFGLRLTEKPKELELAMASSLVRGVYDSTKKIWGVHREHNLEGDLEVPINDKDLAESEDAQLMKGGKGILSRHQSREGDVDYVVTMSFPRVGQLKYILTEKGIGIMALLPNENFAGPNGESSRPIVAAITDADIMQLGFTLIGMSQEQERKIAEETSPPNQE